MQAPDRGARDHEAARANAMRIEQRGQPIGGTLADPDRRDSRPRGDIDPDRFVLNVGAQDSTKIPVVGVRSDFLVIGSGIAGLRAAISLAEVGTVVVLT